MNHKKLSILIVLSLVAGVFAGQLSYDPLWDISRPETEHASSYLLRVYSFLGLDIFMGLLKLLIMPLIVSSVISAICGVSNSTTLGSLGFRAMLYYFSTMLIAVCVGIFCVSLVQPGSGFPGSDLSRGELFGGAKTSVLLENAGRHSESGLLGVFANLVRSMIPSNFFQALVEGRTLGVIVFSIFFGVVVASLGESVSIIRDIAKSSTEVLMKMVEYVLLFSPVGVFCLLAWTSARIGLGVFSDVLGRYMFTVMFGLFLHSAFVLPLVLKIFTRSSPWRFFLQMKLALFTAFSTSSSSATLPVTLDCATRKAKISSESAGLVLPLGATVNMDGTALYEAVAVIFLAQVSGIELHLSQLIVIAFTATLAAIGAAGIPSAGLVTMFIVVDAVNESLRGVDEASALIPVASIGLIIGVDRILDMFRTAVNVWGDAIGAKVVDSS